MRNNLAYIIYDSALNNESVRKIHKKLYDATINSSPMLFTLTSKLADRAVKISAAHKDLDEKAEFLFLLLWKSKYFDKSNAVINKQVQKQEQDNKKQYIDSLIESETIFYVASSHDDSAPDHRDWQGKLYVDANWRSKTDDKDVAKFIRRNHIRTIQWVTDAPVYFITRPHCRHYFIKVSTLDALQGTFVVPHHVIGPRNMQTPRLKQLKYYQQRLRMLTVLHKRYKTKDLAIKMLKTKIIIEKWKKS